MPLPTFTEALRQAQRQARLQGRTLTPQEIGGIYSPYVEQASERNIAAQELELAEEALELEKYTTEKELEAAERAEERGKTQTRLGAMGAGAYAGYKVGGPWGAAVGAGIGLVAPSVLDGCIIISACTSRTSYEVDIAREFRGGFLDMVTLEGYHRLGKAVVPLMERFKTLKSLVKKLLVDRLIDYGEWMLSYKDYLRYPSSPWISEHFLKLCYLIGRRRK